MRTKFIQLLSVTALLFGVSVTNILGAFANFDHVGGGATGSITPNAEPGSYTFVGGGNDIWDTTDEFDFANNDTTGDFDVRVRVESLEPTARWSKAGIMAREDLGTGSRNAFPRVTPGDVPTGNGGNGANDTRYAYRAGILGANGQHEDCISCVAPNYPNGWVRLRRTGSNLAAYSSVDGCNWVLMGDQNTATWADGPFAATAKLGLAVGRHSGPNPTATAQFRQYADVLNDAVTISKHPANTTGLAGQTATFTVQIAGGCDASTFTIDWRKGGASLGVSSTSYTTPILSLGDDADYDVVVVNNLNASTTTSAIGHLTVIDSPIILSVGNRCNPNAVYVQWSKAVTLGGSYSIPGLTVGAVTHDGANQTVTVVATSSQIEDTTYTVTASGVSDGANLQVPNPSSSSWTHGAGVQKVRIVRKKYSGIGGVNLTDLYASPNFPNFPSEVTYPTTFESIPNDSDDNYGVTVSGIAIVPVTGNYKFYMSADDGAATFLSSDANPANKVQVCREPAWNGNREYITGSNQASRGSPPANISSFIPLVSGQRRYLEAQMKEGGGGDNLAVAVEIQGIQAAPVNGQAGIPESFFEVQFRIKGGQQFDNYGPIGFTAVPASVTLNENATVTLTAKLTGSAPYNLQWCRNGDPIPGANSATLTFPATRDDDLDSFVLKASNDFSSASTPAVTVDVIFDDIAPTIVSASSDDSFTSVTICFSEPVNPVIAADAFNYAIDGGLSIDEPSGLGEMSSGNRCVTFNTTPQTPGQTYVITVNSVEDIASVPNVIAPDSTVQFTAYVFAPCVVKQQLYQGIGGGTVTDLRNHPSFPNSPTTTTLQSLMEGPTDAFENYGTRISGYLVALYSGPYNFAVSSDDGSEFWISTDENPVNKFLVCSEPQWNGSRQYETLDRRNGAAPENRSTTLFPGGINLTAGSRYYIELLAKEGGGGDNCSVAMQAPGGPAIVTGSLPLGGLSVGSYVAAGTFTATVNITSHPQPQMKLQNQTATFSVVANSSNGEGLLYQWYKGPDAIPGANSASYTTPPVQLSDDGALFSVEICIKGGGQRSASALLNVNQDAQPPLLVNARGNSSMSHVTIKFDELVDPASATDAFNYSIDGLTIDEPSGFGELGADGMSVTFRTTPQTPGAFYLVHVSGVKDRAENTILDDSQVRFQAFVKSCGFALREFYFGIGGVNIADLRANANYPNNPGLVNYAGLIEAPVDNLQNGNVYDNYGVRVSGLLVPPVTGDYVFYISSDDASEMWLSTDASPANIGLICREPVWAGSRVWTGEAQGGGRGTPPLNISVPIPLVAGQCYYFETLMKEGGGGDNLAVTWQLPGAPVPANGSSPIQGQYLAVMSDPAGASLGINPEPADQLFILNATGGGSSPLSSQDFNSGDGGCTVANVGAPFEGPWTYDGGSGSWKSDGQGPELGRASSTRLTCPPVTVTVSGVVRLSFNHRYSFEAGSWDGGTVLVSINGGAFTTVPASAFTAGNYNGTVLAGSAAENQGQAGFVETSSGHGAGTLINSVCNLGFVSAGNTVTVQFLAANDTNTRNQSPQWEISDLALTQGIANPNVTFSSGAVATGPGPIIYQWFRGTTPIPGANGPDYTFAPALVDNGAVFSLHASHPGVECPGAISRQAVLTVVQPNTPPAFACGPNQSATEDDAAHSVPDWATGIIHHTIPRIPTAFASSFGSMPAGSRLLDPNGATLPNPRVDGGVLKLTDANDPGGFGGWAVGPFPAQTFESISASWKSRVGGGGGGGADGYSLNFGDDLSDNYTGEEGTGSGLSVTVDTFDNGIAGGDVGIEIKWRGNNHSATVGEARVAFTAIPKDDDGSGNYLRKDVFVDASLTVDPSGLATFTYDGNTVSTVLAGFAGAGLRVNQINFGARTGGANDNQWIDDLSLTGFPFDASTAENGQTVSFETTNDRPEKFTQQPSVSPDGTLSYQAAPNACGPVYVTVIARDSGGTAYGGDDTSTPCTFLIDIACVNDCPTTDSTIVMTDEDTAAPVIIPNADVDGDALSLVVVVAPSYGTLTGTLQGGLTYTPNANYCGPDGFTYKVTDGQCETTIHPGVVFIRCVNDCPVAQGYAVMTDEDTAVGTPVTAWDADGDVLSFVITSGPAHGTLSGSGATATYTPSHNYCGPDSFKFQANDGQCRSAEVTVSITVKCVNDAPTCDIVVSPLFKITPSVTECVLLSCNNVDSDVILNGSLSSDVEGDSLTFVWLDNGVPFDTGMVVSNQLDVGTHIITLIVSDGTDSSTCTKTVTVIDLCEAVDELVILTEQSTISRKNKKPLFEALKNACKEYEKDKCKEGKKKLESYQDKVRQHLRKGEVDAATAARLISAAQAILDGCPDCSKKPVKVKSPTKAPTKRPTRNN